MSSHSSNILHAPEKDENRDPITGTPGAHPIGTGLGAVGAGAVAGATAGVVGGAVAGPVGAVAGAAIGATVGAVVGGFAGKAAAEAVNPTNEANYWRDTFPSRPYSHSDFGYEDHAPAYRYGWESFGRHGGQGKTFDNVESDLVRGWQEAKGESRLGWEQAKAATRDAWDRVQLAARGPAKRNID